MEVAGLVLGVVPLAVEILKAWKTVHDKAIQYTHATTIVDSIYCRINTQGLLFRGELSGLLIAVGIDKEETERMLADKSHSKWQDASTDIAKYLGERCVHDYVRLAHQIMRQLQALKDKLLRLDDVYSARKRDQWKSKMRLIMGSKDDFEQQFDQLRSDNYDLIRVRKQCQGNESHVTKPKGDSHTGFITIPIIHKAFTSLGETLVNSWSCDSQQHNEHSLCLNLDVDIGSGGCLRSNLALQYDTKQRAPQVVSDTASSYLLLEARSNSKGRGTPLGFKKGNATMCVHLAKCSCGDTTLLGRLNAVPGGYPANLFHDDSRCAKMKIHALRAPETNLNEALDWFQDPIDMYELGLRLALAVLHLHATPWLPDTWRLNGITLLHADEPVDALRTLSVTMTIPQHLQSNKSSTQNYSEDYYVSGVHNMMLFSLGVALLEIEHSKSIEIFKSKSESDFTTARRLAARPDTIAGRRYRNLAKKCLDCGFGCDEQDLANEDFQKAVYGGIVHELKKLADC